MRTFVSLLLVVALFGCSSASTVRLDSAPATAPEGRTRPEDVAIYRATKPPYPYAEIGFTTIEGVEPRIERIYKDLRKEASRQGGDAVVDVKIRTELKVVPVAITSCGPRGCVPSTTFEQRLHYKATGTVVRRK